jgi:hypothetical protein
MPREKGQKAGSLRLHHDPLTFPSEEAAEDFLTQLALRLGVQPNRPLPPAYFTFRQMIGGPLKAKNWYCTNVGRSMFTICLGDMGTLQAVYQCAEDIDIPFLVLVATVYPDPAHPARAEGKVWLCYGPGPDEDGVESLFGLNNMIVHETRTEEMIELVNRVIALKVS